MAKNPFSVFPLLNYLTRECGAYLTDRERILAVTIALHRQADKNLLCNPTITKLCREMGHCRQVIIEALASLSMKQIIKIDFGKGKRPNHYTFLFDSEEMKNAREKYKQECSQLPF